MAPPSPARPPLRLRHLPVLKRLIPSLRKRLAALAWPGGICIRQVDGARFLLDWRNFVDREIAFWGDYEAAQLALQRNHAGAGLDVFIDVGANLGYYTVLIARAAPAARIIAFEPDPRNFAQLNANLWLNRLSGRVEAHRLAVSDTAGPLPFAAQSDRFTGKSRIGSGDTGLAVAAVRLDDVLDLGGQRLAVKIDIEGHELPALAGMRRLLTANRVLLQVECFAANRPALESLMAELGYRRLAEIGDDHLFTNA